MKNKDYIIENIDINFKKVVFLKPLNLSKGKITELSEATVTVNIVDQNGSQASGIGSVLLSYPWAWPDTELTNEACDDTLRMVLKKIIEFIDCNNRFLNPLEMGIAIDEQLDDILSSFELNIPRLAGAICVAPLDAAIHDAWGKLHGKSVYKMYTKEYLYKDLSAYIGNIGNGIYPSDLFLEQQNKSSLIQHVVDIGADLDELYSSITKENIRSLKIKCSGSDPLSDARQIQEIYKITKSAVQDGSLCLSLDPNESYTDIESLIELIDRLNIDSPEIYDSIQYIEQPFLRTVRFEKDQLQVISERIPLIADEGYTHVSDLPELMNEGWSGIALKTAKGMTQSLLSYSFAKISNKFITLQDLTNVNDSLLQSASLASHLYLSTQNIECNSRQYLPNEKYFVENILPDFIHTSDGTIRFDKLENVGIY
ncbi:MAG: mandelate racemase/muconate lactonizing enzyme family protein [Acidimicrobiia bacterium]